MTKPYHTVLLAALLAFTGAICLGVAGREPRAAAALGVALIAAVTALAMYLYDQQSPGRVPQHNLTYRTGS